MDINNGGRGCGEGERETGRNETESEGREAMQERGRGGAPVAVIYSGEVCSPVAIKKMFLKEAARLVAPARARERFPAAGIVTSLLSPWRCPAHVQFSL